MRCLKANQPGTLASVDERQIFYVTDRSSCAWATSGYMIFSSTGCAGSCIGMEFGNTYVYMHLG